MNHVVGALRHLGAGGPDDNEAQAGHLVAFGGNDTRGPISIATARNAHGGTGRLDFESETFVVGALGTTRRLTPTEAERLQALPEGWTCLCLPLADWAHDPEEAAERCSCPDSPRYRSVGNAVTTTVARWLGARLATAILEEETR